MGAVTIRNIPDDVHRALKDRAARNNRSTEAEVRAILADSVAQPDERSFGDILQGIVARAGVTNEDVAALVEAIESGRDRRPAEPISFD